jgi:hypothetical protein
MLWYCALTSFASGEGINRNAMETRIKAVTNAAAINPKKRRSFTLSGVTSFS